MRTILVDQSGIQILPPSRDPHQMISSWAAYQTLSADQRAKHAPYADLAARLFIVKEQNQ